MFSNSELSKISEEKLEAKKYMSEANKNETEVEIMKVDQKPLLKVLFSFSPEKNRVKAKCRPKEEIGTINEIVTKD